MTQARTFNSLTRDHSREPSMPHVSVVIPTYKRPEALIRAVRSALNQTFNDLEVIVVAEQDDPASVTAVASLGDARVRHVVNAERGGPGRARDAGLATSAGHWIAFLDDDDTWLPTKLEKQIAAARDDSNVILMTLSTVVTAAGSSVQPAAVYSGDEPIDEWLFGRRSWLKGGQSMLQTSSLMLPRALFDKLSFGSSRHEEWELAIRAVKQHGYKLVTVAEPLVVYYSGNTYDWRKSVPWIESMKDVLTARAFSGFCLTVATKGLTPPDRNRAFLTFLRLGVRHGEPTARQLFAFALIWLLPDSVRHRIRAALRGERRRSGQL